MWMKINVIEIHLVEYNKNISFERLTFWLVDFLVG